MRASTVAWFIAPLVVMTASPSLADTPGDAGQPKGRYSMSPVDGGFLRLDTETGAVALCVKKDPSWACEPVKDGTAGPASTADLEAENKALKDRVKALEDAKGTTPPSTEYPAEPPGGGVSQLPTEEEVDKAFDYIEGMYKKLRERIKKFEAEPGTTPGTKPDATPNTAPGEGGSGAL